MMVSSFTRNRFTLLILALLMGRDNTMMRLMLKLRPDGIWGLSLVVKMIGLPGHACPICVD